MTGGRHRTRYPDGMEWAPTGRSRRRGRRTATTVAVSALVFTVVGAVTAVLVDQRHRATPAADACTGATPLVVVAAPDIAPIVRLGARTVGGGRPGCPLISVTSQDPAETESRLDGVDPASGTFGRQQLPDVWVPDSSAWLWMGAAAQPGLFPTSAASLARSPLVVAMSQSVAESLGWPSTSLGWTDLEAAAERHRVRLAFPSPLASTAGLLGVLAVDAALGRSQPDPGIAEMRSLTFRSRLSDTTADLSALLHRLADEPDSLTAAREVGAFPMVEQQLWSYNKDGHRVPLVAVYPRDATVEADYPMAVSRVAAADPRHAMLADRLAGWFRTDAATRALTEHGFRYAGHGGPPPDGLGLADSYPRPTPLSADPASIPTEASTWAHYRPLAFHLLVLVDGSGSMNNPVRDRAGRVRTKASLLRDAGAQAGELLGEETSVGLWEFSTHRPGVPYQEVVRYGPIDGPLDGPLGSSTRRQAMVSAATGFQAFPGSGTPLYETVLRAVGALREVYQPGTLSMVMVLTDGNDESSPFHMDTSTFLSRLSKAEDPKRPVPIFAVGYGADADLTALTAMARATGGQAIPSVDPADLATAIARVFLAAHERN